MSKVEIKNLEVLRKMIDVQHLLSQQMIAELMADVLLEIIRLTNKGLNAYAQPFTPYSKATVNHKVKTGRSTTPNMQQTSSMLSSLNVKPITVTKIIKYKISASGSFKGVSNKAKLVHLANHKNYIILEWTPNYMKLVDKHSKIFQRRAAQRMSNL